MITSIYKCKDEQILKELCSIFRDANPLHELKEILFDDSLSMEDTIKLISERFRISKKTSEFILNMKIDHFCSLNDQKVEEAYEKLRKGKENSNYNRFFIPYVGKNYETGINGKKILVTGASFYCDKRNCKYFDDCTSPDKKDSSSYNANCPEYIKNNAVLEREPEYAIEENYSAYQRFSKCMKQVAEIDDIWQYVAFTNYVQFFVPTVNTYKIYLSERDFEAFNETIVQLQPDIIISWGMVTIDAVRTNNPYVVDFDELKETEWYICHLDMKELGVNHPITLVCCFHPSSRDWNSDKGKFIQYMKMALKE
jgi:hypothetical protein